MPSMQPQDDVSPLMARFEALRVAYERFMNGLERAEPRLQRDAFVADMRRMVTRPPKNTAQQFRLQSLKARLQTFEALWDRTAAQQERTGQRGRGSKTPSIALQEKPAVDRDAAAQNQWPDDAAELYSKYAQALGQAEQPVPSLESFRAMVAKNAAAIKMQTGWQNIAFRVIVHEGRPALKAFNKP